MREAKQFLENVFQIINQNIHMVMQVYVVQVKVQYIGQLLKIK